jgi:hypothetical protein
MHRNRTETTRRAAEEKHMKKTNTTTDEHILPLTHLAAPPPPPPLQQHPHVNQADPKMMPSIRVATSVVPPSSAPGGPGLGVSPGVSTSIFI